MMPLFVFKGDCADGYKFLQHLRDTQKTKGSSTAKSKQVGKKQTGMQGLVGLKPLHTLTLHKQVGFATDGSSAFSCIYLFERNHYPKPVRTVGIKSRQYQALEQTKFTRRANIHQLNNFESYTLPVAEVQERT